MQRRFHFYCGPTCHPRMVGAIRSWRRDTRPSRLPRFIHRILIALF